MHECITMQRRAQEKINQIQLACQIANPNLKSKLPVCQCEKCWIFLKKNKRMIAISIILLQQNDPAIRMTTTVECHINTVEFIMILHMALWWQQQNINQTSNSQQTTHTSPSKTCYGVLLWEFWRKLAMFLRYCTVPNHSTDNIMTAVDLVKPTTRPAAGIVLTKFSQNIPA